MVNWLKDLSLFDHFLQGLFKYLSEDSNKSTDLIGDCFVTYVRVVYDVHTYICIICYVCTCV